MHIVWVSEPLCTLGIAAVATATGRGHGLPVILPFDAVNTRRALAVQKGALMHSEL
jgi:hypothetical protein